MQGRRTETTPGDYTIEQGRLVFTAEYLLRRGTCCGNGCRHCPYPNEDDPHAESVPTTTSDASAVR